MQLRFSQVRFEGDVVALGHGQPSYC